MKNGNLGDLRRPLTCGNLVDLRHLLELAPADQRAEPKEHSLTCEPPLICEPR